MPAEPLSRLLRKSPELESVRDRLETVGLLQDRYRSIAPEGLASSSRVCAIEGLTVVVRADNAPVAAALRAMAPRLLAGLTSAASSDKNSFKNKQEGNLTGLRVEVQVDAAPPRRKVIARGEFPAERLAEVAAGLSQSPLKEALTRIARGQTKSSTRSKR
jgi:hypothetical protein